MDTELLSKGMVHLALRPHETFFYALLLNSMDFFQGWWSTWRKPL